MTEQGTSPGTLIDGRYLLRRQIGGGGAAIVWLGEDLKGQTPIAVKLLHPKLRAVDSVLSRLTLEAQLLSSLDHPNIARAVSFGLDRIQPFIALEYIEGSTLQAEIGARSPIDDHFDHDLLSRLFGQLCSAVDHAHGLGIVHRDLKPANVMLQATSEGAVVKVLDFGIAKMIDQHPSAATTQGRMLGSVAFMSPEQARGDPVDHRTDVFALGVILQELLTLRRVWALDDEGRPVRAYAEPMRLKGQNTPQAMFERIANGRRPRPSELRPELGQEVDALIDRALATRPEDRFPSAAALKAAVEEVLAGREDTLEPTFVRDPTKLYTELRTQAYQPADPTFVPLAETTSPSPNPAMFTPAPLFPTPHGMMLPKPARSPLAPLLFGGGGLAIGILATLVMVRLTQRPAASELPVQPAPALLTDAPSNAPRAVAERDRAPEPAPPEDTPAPAIPQEQPPTRTPGRRAPPTKEPSTGAGAPAEPERPAVPWARLEALLAAGSREPDKLDELSKQLQSHAQRVTDTGKQKKIVRLAQTHGGDTAVLSRALQELRGALE